MVNRGLHHRAIDSHLPPTRDLELPSERDDVVEQRLQRLRSDEPRPPEEGRVIGDPLPAEAAELPQDEAVADEVLGLGVAPVIEPFDDQQPEDDLDRRGGAAGAPGMGEAAREVGLDDLQQGVVVEQLVEPGQDGFECQGQSRDEGEPIDGRGAVT